MLIFKAFVLFVFTAIAEILGCYLPYVWLRKSGSPWLLIPAAMSLAVSAARRTPRGERREVVMRRAILPVKPAMVTVALEDIADRLIANRIPQIG